MSAHAERHDIENRADCERLVRAFYARAMTDPMIGWIFVDVAKLDLEAHVPVIASFWETILLGSQTYRGGAFRPHAALHLRVGLRPGHFERWLTLWNATVDDLFAGERAELAKAHAVRVARAFLGRLQTMPATGPDAAAELDPGLPVLPITIHGDTPPGSS
jgi:hemoglobin